MYCDCVKKEMKNLFEQMSIYIIYTIVHNNIIHYTQMHQYDVHVHVHCTFTMYMHVTIQCISFVIMVVV